MSDFVLSCCSTADLSKEYLESRNIEYICFHYELDGISHLDDFGTTISLPEFYAAMAAGSETSTSQVNISEYMDFFERKCREGKDILHISFSSGLSGSFNSAKNAANICAERYPERKIIIIDSLAASSGYGLLMDKAADLRDEGMNIDELAAWVEENKLKLHHWFFSTDLTFYIKGGRVSKAAGVVAGILDICPLLHVDREGHLIPMEKVRTKKKVKLQTLKKMQDFAEGGEAYSEKVFISNSACLQDAMDVARLVEENFPNMNGKVKINDIGTVIGSHTGPGTVALFFWGKSRAEE
ncbi:MAG: DegV family protein [Lachnospiraceae bacterium]|nr:DegV family protein [Lachnospiraceae bacterium]